MAEKVDQMDPDERSSGQYQKIEVLDGIDADVLTRVLANLEMTALLTSLAKTIIK